MIKDGKTRNDVEHKERVKKLQMDLNISRSKAINQARLLKMKVREDYMQMMRKEMLEDLKTLKTDNRDKYLNTVKNLVLQTMIRLLETEVHVLCREEDKNDLSGMKAEIEEQYTTFMNEKTGRDYACTINIIEDKSLTDDQDMGCGGVVVYNSDKAIMCPNMICTRLK